MKRERKPAPTAKPKLVLRRETIKTLDDDALQQARGGAAYGSSGLVAEFQEY
jgi:hypothetical protein